MNKINKKMQEIKEKEFALDIFKIDLDDLFTMLNDKIQEQYPILDNINKESGVVLTGVINDIEKIRYVFFKFCCDFSKKEVFDIAFHYYRNFLIELARVETRIDNVCIDVFDGEIKKHTLEIQENK